MNCNTLSHLAWSLGLSLTLVACGGGSDETAPSSAGTGASTCETLQFASGSGARVPSSAEYAAVAKSYTSGTTTVVLSSSGALSVNGSTIDVKSACFVVEPSGNLVMLSWGTANTVGAGNIVYDSHIDFRSSGISGVADGTIL